MRFKFNEADRQRLWDLLDQALDDYDDLKGYDFDRVTRGLEDLINETDYESEVRRAMEDRDE